MRKRILLILLFPIGLINAQGRLNSQPGYNPIYPRLISKMHDYDASTQLEKKDKFTLEEFNSKENYQRIETYFCYERDSILEKMGDAVFFNPPKKLMDFFIVHHYNYKLNSVSLFSEENFIIPEIPIPSKTFLESIKVKYYYLKKAKLKSGKLKKSEFSSNISQEKLIIKLSNTTIPQDSYVEIDIKLKSRNFEDVNPTISKNIENSEYSIRIPKLLEYEVSPFETAIIEDGELKMLKFFRDTTDWDKMINAFEIGFRSYSWTGSKDSFLAPKLKLSQVKYPIGSDIGFPLEYFLQTE